MLDHPLLLASKYHMLDDGKRMRYALFEPEKTHGTILIAPGRREFIEKKYAEMGPQLLQRGFRLIFFEWRGQGLSDRLLSGAKRQRDHIDRFEMHLNDLDSFYRKIVKPTQSGPLIVSGHSMGSHLILRWLAERQKEGIAAAFLTAPMVALANHTIHSVARAMSWAVMHLGHDIDYAPAQHDYDGQDREFKDNPLTHDSDRFKIMERYFAAYPDLTVGGVTWGWLDAALRSITHVQQRSYFQQLTLPVMTLVGNIDRVTPVLELSRIMKRIPGAESVVLPNALHDILNETDGIRIEAWGHIDRFFERILS